MPHHTLKLSAPIHFHTRLHTLHGTWQLASTCLAGQTNTCWPFQAQYLFGHLKGQHLIVQVNMGMDEQLLCHQCPSRQAWRKQKQPSFVPSTPSSLPLAHHPHTGTSGACVWVVGTVLNSRAPSNQALNATTYIKHHLNSFMPAQAFAHFMALGIA